MGRGVHTREVIKTQPFKVKDLDFRGLWGKEFRVLAFWTTRTYPKMVKPTNSMDFGFKVYVYGHPIWAPKYVLLGDVDPCLKVHAT